MAAQKGSGGGGRGGGPAPFLVKTHQMVEESATDDVISWGEKGMSFVVWKPVEFARDLLPLHFKHNNFSSFVRQLNTYGFRKAVPDRWEFANENFRRGEQSLLAEIRRRKVVTSPSSHATKSCGGGGGNVSLAFPPSLPPLPPASATNSGNDHGSSSTSSPPPRRALLDLTSENQQLKKDNHLLTEELAQSRRHCEELLGFLSRFLDVRQLDLRVLMQEDMKEKEERHGARHQEAKEEKCVKLFGVLLKGLHEGDGSKNVVGRKRERCEDGGIGDRPMKMMDLAGVPWVGVPAPARPSGGRVCH